MALALIPPTLPEDFCEQSSQDQANILIGGTQITGTADPEIIFSETEPGVDDRDKAWGLLAPGGINTGFIFTYSGDWLLLHEYDASGDVRMIWTGTLADISLFDGGTAAALTDRTGPMWERDTDFNGRSPMGVGAIPTSNPAKSLGEGEDYGEGAHLMTEEEVGPHDHPLAGDAAIQDGRRINIVNTGAGGAGLLIGLTGPPATDLSVSDNTYVAGQQSMPVIHPVRGCYLIKRTSRIYRTPADSV